MLGKFHTREADFVSRFRAARAAGDQVTSARVVHDLKSAAGTLGMHSLMESAIALERHLEAQSSEVDAALQAVSDDLDKVIDQVLAIQNARAA